MHRTVNASGHVSVAGQYVNVGAQHAGRRILLRLDTDLAHVDEVLGSRGERGPCLGFGQGAACGPVSEPARGAQQRGVPVPDSGGRDGGELSVHHGSQVCRGSSMGDRADGWGHWTVAGVGCGVRAVSSHPGSGAIG